jgi:hypothetical protein
VLYSKELYIIQKMSVIAENDPRYFTCTSVDPYDRHNYKIISKDGKAIIVDSYMQAQLVWFQSSCGYFLDRIEVVDK